MKQILMLVLLMASPCFAQKSANRVAFPTNQAVQGGRYQLYAVKALGPNTAGGQSTFDELFILDTLTCRVWQYAPYNPPKDQMQIGIPAGFEELMVDNLNGDSRLAQIQRVAAANAELEKPREERDGNETLKKNRDAQAAEPNPKR
jgi:hypothetical protein